MKLRTLGKWDYCWDGTGMAVCVWWYPPSGGRTHCGTFRVEHQFRFTAEVREAQRAMQDRYITANNLQTA